MDNIAIKGRIILFGAISGYHEVDKSKQMLASDLTNKLLFRAGSLRGFISSVYPELYHPHMQKLLGLIKDGKLKAGVDSAKFEGLEQVADAIDYMYDRKNIGKLVVKLAKL